MSSRLPLFFFFLSLFIFVSFGLFHLGKFETTDEHLWKYDRIGNYWEALKKGEWADTYINDKPGITVALISGLGLLHEPSPHKNERRDLPEGEARLFEAYNTDQAEKTNITFRLPILFFTIIALGIFFFLLTELFSSLWIALFVTLFITANPLLLGIAQIINPDSFFWIFGFLTTLSFLNWLQEKTLRWAIFTGLSLGFALLSKYTAFLLFLLFALLSTAHLLFRETQHVSRAWFISTLKTYVIIFLTATLTFFIFLPATFLNPTLFFKGFSQFFLLKHWPYWIGMSALLGISFGFLWKFFSDSYLSQLQVSLEKYRLNFFRIIGGLFLFLIISIIINSWSGQYFSPVESLRDAAYANEPQAFNFRPVLEKNVPPTEKWSKLLLMQGSPLVFTLSPLMLLLIIAGALGGHTQLFRKETRSILLSVFGFILLYLVATIFAKVVTNARYMIILYPLLALAAGLTLHDILSFIIKRYNLNSLLVLSGATILILLSSILTLWTIRPFYFSYTNSLLPQSISLHDSWGHGAYEAAQYLNSLPQAQELIIWSSSDTVCRFFVGKCLKSRRIDLGEVKPDYLVMSKRGIIKERNQPLFENNPWPKRDTAYYIDKIQTRPDWKLEILERPDNFLNIVQFEKE